MLLATQCAESARRGRRRGKRRGVSAGPDAALSWHTGPVRPALKGERDEGLAAIAAAGPGGRGRRASPRHGGGCVGGCDVGAQARVTAILVTSHVVASWGYNAQGQLGDGTTTSRSLFGDIRAGSDVVQVAAGNGHGLALRSDGTVWAWGDNRAGQLGRGRTSIPVTRSSASRSTPCWASCGHSRADLAGCLTAVVRFAGRDHRCRLGWSWGGWRS
jgi:hypothetical protein